MNHHLLVIKDDTYPARRITDVLRDRGYTVVTASNFDFFVDPGLADNFDLVLIDHSESVSNAIDICEELRQRHVEVPVVVMAVRNGVQDRLATFKAGADDYLVKPVDFDELQARIEALLARSVRRRKTEVLSYEFGGMHVDFRRGEIVRNGSTIELSERESRLLRFFVENRGRIVSRSALLQHVWGYRRAPLTRTVDVHILRLRHKIEDDPKDPQFIVTVHGLGYRFDG